MFSLEAYLSAIRDNKVREASLSHRGLDDVACREIASVVRDTSELRVLDLQTNNITSRGVIELCEALKINQGVKEVNLEHNNVDETGASAVLELLQMNRTITAFLLTEGNGISKSLLEEINFHAALNTQPGALKTLAPLLLKNDPSAKSLDLQNSENVSLPLLASVIRRNSTLETLGLAGLGLGDTGADIVAGILRDQKSVVTVDLSNNMIGIHGVKSLIENCLKTNRTITSLNMQGNKIGDDASRMLVDLLKVNDNVTSLNLTGNAVTMNAMEAVSRALELNRQPLELKKALYRAIANDPSLTEIDVSWLPSMQASASFLAPGLKANTFVSVLLLSNARIGDTGAADIANVLRFNKSIRQLALANDDLTSVGGSAIAHALLRNSTLTDLNLANNKIAADAGAIFCEMLQQNNTLMTLNLELNEVPDDQMDEIDGLLTVNQQPLGLKAILPLLESNSPKCTVVDFSKYDGVRYHTDKSVMVLCQALRANKTVTTLDLSCNAFGDTGATQIASVLYSNASLTSVALSHNSIGDRGTDALAKSLYENTTLQKLLLDNNVIGENGAEALLLMLQRNHFVSCITVDGNRVPPIVMNDVRIACAINTQPMSLKAALPRIRSKDPTLTALDVSVYDGHRYYTDAAVTILCHELQDNEHLTLLDLSHNKFGLEGAKSVARLISTPTCHLRILNLSHNDLGDDSAVELAQSFEKNQTLQQVDLRNTKISSDGAVALATSLSKNNTITELQLTKTNISAAAQAQLTRELTTNSQRLEVKQLLPAMRSNDPSLTVVDLSGTDAAPIMNDLCCRLIAMAMAKNTHVTTLNLSHNTITAEGVEYLADMLEDNLSVHELLLNSNRITNEGANYIVKMMSTNDNIFTIDLSDNPITEDVMSEIGYLVRINRGPLSLKKVMVGVATNDLSLRALQFDGQTREAVRVFEDDAVHILCSLLVDNKCVEQIFLSNNRITDTGASYLADVLRVNTTIKVLTLSNNLIGKEGSEALAQALHANYTLEELPLDGNPDIEEEVLEDIHASLQVNRQPLRQPKRPLKNYRRRPKVTDLTTDELFRDPDFMHECEEQIFDDALQLCPPELVEITRVWAEMRGVNNNVVATIKAAPSPKK